MEISAWGWELIYDRDQCDELGYGWKVCVEEAASDKRHIRTSPKNKPHKEALRNAKAALRRLRHKIAGTKPHRRLSRDAHIWAIKLGIPT